MVVDFPEAGVFICQSQSLNNRLPLDAAVVQLFFEAKRP